MSLIIKGGYNVFRKNALNVILKPTSVWASGFIFGPKNCVIGELSPQNENRLELVKYNDDNGILLLHNNTIIYEQTKLFNYKIDLYCPVKPEWNNENFKTFLDFKYVSYQNLRSIDEY